MCVVWNMRTFASLASVALRVVCRRGNYRKQDCPAFLPSKQSDEEANDMNIMVYMQCCLGWLHGTVCDIETAFTIPPQLPYH